MAWHERSVTNGLYGESNRVAQVDARNALMEGASKYFRSSKIESPSCNLANDTHERSL